MTQTVSPTPVRRSPEEIVAQKKRNVWLALALVGFILLVGITSAIRIQGTDFSKSEGFYNSGALQKKSNPPPVLQPPAETPEEAPS